ncbi:uncharacterized protein TOT_030000504 [Theileria orientalis strain Shintoku]|uniref:Folate/biopterin transporter n=1 Tax=Theileria orientalis strain Shintoku TaxID=869250 RepID=J4C3Y4_THEOR|nr:uncharacterized protein TOT_030000504 [Theileria orientalis strain Shintoku]BAM41241.1 uncharacterized protein TOT_030000504 [Theileria orientalis strain Shintoku]|eukprot:XP_009691542.1 uncharacterized protein TOT_030000504 [Theileria orientalis strain Shintoku]
MESVDTKEKNETIPVTFDSDNWTRFFSIRRSTNKVVILLIYMVGFSEGLLHLSNLAIYYMFKDDFGLSPAQLSLVYAIPYIPFIIRPSLAYLTDTVPIFGTRRRHYLLFNSLAQSASFFFLAAVPNTLILSILVLFVVFFTLAFCMTIAEALVVENITENRDNLSGLLLSRAFSTLLVSYFSGSLLEKHSKQRLFFITGFFPLLIMAVAYFMKEENEPVVFESHPMKDLVSFLKQPVILHPCLYLFLVVSTPGYHDAFTYYTIDVLGYSPSFMGVLRLVYAAAVILGIGLYRFFFKEASVKKIFFWCSLIANSFYGLPLLVSSGLSAKMGIPDKPLVLCSGFLTEAVFEIKSMPFLTYTTKVTPKGLEASVFASILTLKSVGVVISKLLTSLFTYLFGITNHNYDHMTLYIVFCTTNLFIVMIYLRKVPSKEVMDLLVTKQNMVDNPEHRRGKLEERHLMSGSTNSNMRHYDHE